MKKFLIILLSLVLIVFCVGCGSYQPPIIDGSGSTSGSGGSGGTGSGGDNPNNPPDGPTPPEEEVIVFTVSLFVANSDGKLVRFIPDASMNIKAQWEGADGIFIEPFDSLGVARAYGLDGEYRITLSDLPKDYTYNPNGIEADNDLRDINIELLPYTTTPDKKTSEYDCIRLNTEGTYKVKLSKKTDLRHFEYQPQGAGIYTIESIVDITAGKINPRMIKYGGTIGFKWVEETVNDGGASGSYTKNFKWQIQLDDSSYVGNVWTFAISADVATGVDYPVDVYFKLTFVGLVPPLEIVQAKGPFYNGPQPTGTFQWSFFDNPNGTDSDGNNRYYTDSSLGANGNPMRFRLNWTDYNGNGEFDEWIDLNGDGKRDENEIGLEGDGFYHFYDPVIYADNDGWGPLLWTIISGWDCLDHPKGTGGQKMDSLQGSRVFTATKNYSYFMEEYAKYAKSTSAFGGGERKVNGIYEPINGIIGVHPLTRELMLALQELAPVAGDGYFMDGDGVAESGPRGAGMEDSYESKIRVDSSEDYMFLLFCGYFK